MKRLTILILTLVLATMAQAQTVTHVYHYNNPVVSERDGYQQISLEGCLPLGQLGEPTLPWQNVSLILPQGQEALDMQVEFSDLKFFCRHEEHNSIGICSNIKKKRHKKVGVTCIAPTSN